MPELPEVETVVRGLRPDVVGRVIQSVTWDWERTIATPTPDEFAFRVSQQAIHAITRRAKYIVMTLQEGYLLVHLKMTGRLYVSAPVVQSDADKWVRVRFALNDGRELRFSDSRKFGRVYWVHDVATITGAIGPEPLEADFTPQVLRERLAGHRRAIKPLLLDQAILAGVGNIYADEALFRAKINPNRPTDSLTDAEITALHGAIQAALAAGIQHEGASINWYRKPDGTQGKSQNHFYVYDRESQACLVCGQPIEKIRLGQRGTHFCPHCQL